MPSGRRDPVKVFIIIVLVLLTIILLMLIMFDDSCTHGHRQGCPVKPRQEKAAAAGAVAVAAAAAAAVSAAVAVVVAAVAVAAAEKNSATAYRNKLDYLGFPNVTNTSAVKLQHYGYSFAADDISWLKSQLSTVADKVKQLHKDNGLLTAGLAYYSRPDAATDSNLANIKSIMTSINGMLNAAQDKNTTILKTTFLAVKLSGKDSSARNDASALQELKGIANIDLLILLTHLVNVPSHPNCKILPLSRYAADALDSIEPPSMERLLNSIDKLKEAKFRVAFSTSFAMYLFKPLGGLKDTTKFGDKCMHSFYDDMSALCDVPDASIIEDKKNPAVSTATYSNKQSGIFMVFETNNATRVKVSQALVKAREKGVMLTWAVYEVHRDQMLCENKRKTLERLATVNDSMVTIFFPRKDDR
ncbi:uncharacterized protein [Dermacentor andersoni]|uniref:uncharacterized protein n=1 Tax=Dermacentor andersoni TaxID=34620 RepID=UPI003B3B8527